MIIESRKTYLGKNAVKNGEPMILGNKLIEILQEILGIFKESQGLCQGAPLPLVDSQNAPLSAKIPPIEQKLNRLLSQYYFIEPNDTQK